MIYQNSYIGKKVLITGHTGFKGTWLGWWLSELGAEVFGFSLFPSVDGRYDELGLGQCFQKSYVGDIRDFEAIENIMLDVKPDFVFHLAAQAIVSKSFDAPLETFATNALGTANLLQALRAVKHECATVLITSDKVYKNVEWLWGYRENDQLGGADPYSASKAAAELFINSYINAIYEKDLPVKIAVGRAGNVIGGGDWSKDRIVPDCIRNWMQGISVDIRNPQATRPWQHVLEPVSGYCALGAELSMNNKLHAEAFNFGPRFDENFSVQELVMEMAKYQENARFISKPSVAGLREATLLKLDCTKASQVLGWSPKWQFEETVKATMSWYTMYQHETGNAIVDLMKKQIRTYMSQLG